MMPAADVNRPPSLLVLTIEAGGRAQIACHIPKLEAVKLLLSIVEELRAQAYEEQNRLIQVPSPTVSGSVQR